MSWLKSERERLDIVSVRGLRRSDGTSSDTGRLTDEVEASDSIDWLLCRLRLGCTDMSKVLGEGELAGEGRTFAFSIVDAFVCDAQECHGDGQHQRLVWRQCQCPAHETPMMDPQRTK